MISRLHGHQGRLLYQTMKDVIYQEERRKMETSSSDLTSQTQCDDEIDSINLFQR